MRSLSCSMLRPSDRLFAKDADVLGNATLGERLGLLHPRFALDSALDVQVAVDPLALCRLPGSDLHEGVDSERMQCALDLRAYARNQLQIVSRGRFFDSSGPVSVAQ